MAKTKSSVEEVVRWTLMEQLGCSEDEITPTASFVNDLGCDSLDSVEIVMSFEEKFGIEIPDGDLEKFQTVGDVIAYLKERVE
jgi:acyl carrier protein